MTMPPVDHTGGVLRLHQQSAASGLVAAAAVQRHRARQGREAAPRRLSGVLGARVRRGWLVERRAGRPRVGLPEGAARRAERGDEGGEEGGGQEEARGAGAGEAGGGQEGEAHSDGGQRRRGSLRAARGQRSTSKCTAETARAGGAGQAAGGVHGRRVPCAALAANGMAANVPLRR